MLVIPAVQPVSPYATEVTRFGQFYDQAMGLLTSSGARQALNLEAESDTLRGRYGRTRFGVSTRGVDCSEGDCGQNQRTLDQNTQVVGVEAAKGKNREGK